jgi:hypothetical protein
MHSSSASNHGMPSHLKSSSCTMAVSFYKLVSERGVWGDDLVRDAEAAWLSDSPQEKEIAMLKWRIAAERGSEIAQNNLAYNLDQGQNLIFRGRGYLTRHSRPNVTSTHKIFTFSAIKRHCTSSSYTLDSCSITTQRRRPSQGGRLLLSRSRGTRRRRKIKIREGG